MQLFKDKLTRARLFIFLLLGLGYAFFYLSRYNFSVAHAAIATYLGWDYKDFGNIVGTALMFYGIAVVLMGGLVDSIGGKRAMLIGIRGILVANILFGLTYLLIQTPAIYGCFTTNKDILQIPVIRFGLSSGFIVTVMGVMWTVNYIFQTFGALSVIKINSAWYTEKERGKQAGAFGVIIQLGRVMVLLLCPIILVYLPWPFVFWLPAILLLIVHEVIRRKLHEKPEDAGFEIFKTKYVPGKYWDNIKLIFKNKTMWIIAGLSFTVGVSRNGIEHWVVRFLIENFLEGKSERLSSFIPFKIFAITMPISLMLASIIVVPLSDILFKSRRFPLVAINSLGVIGSIWGLITFLGNPYLAIGFIILTMFFIQASHGLILGAATMDFGGRKSSATAGGFLDGSQYIGGALATYYIGNMLDKMKLVGGEFKYWPIPALLSAIITLAIALVLWNSKAKEEVNN